MKTEMHLDTPATGLTVIERSHPSQTVAGLAVLNHLANAPGGCCFDELYALFLHTQGGLKSIHTTPHNLRACLAHMASRGYVVVCEGRGDKRRYRLGDRGKLPSTAKTRGALQATLTARAAAADAQAYCGIRVPPRQYDVMYGPVYAPPRSAAPRAGSLDFTRLASHGHGC